MKDDYVKKAFERLGYKPLGAQQMNVATAMGIARSVVLEAEARAKKEAVKGCSRCESKYDREHPFF